MNMDEGIAPIVVVKGHKYIVIDQDLSKGDRRCDGPALSSFFSVEGGSDGGNNARESNRIKKRKELTPTVINELHDTTFHGLEFRYIYHATTVHGQRFLAGITLKTICTCQPLINAYSLVQCRS